MIKGINSEDLEDAALGLIVLRKRLLPDLENARDRLCKIKAASYDQYVEMFCTVKARQDVIDEIDALIKQGKEGIL